MIPFDELVQALERHRARAVEESAAPVAQQAARNSGKAQLIDREARSAAVIDREARSAAVIDREARSAAVIDREARSDPSEIPLDDVEEA